MEKAIKIIKNLIEEHHQEGWYMDYDTAQTEDQFYDSGRYETLCLILREFENENKMRKFLLTEIGFDSSEETENSLIKVAEDHRKSYDDERKLLPPITTVEKAVEYFERYGFEVKELK